MTTPHPACVAAITDHLRDQAADYLAHADRNRARGDKGNADWCTRAAFGLARAAGSVRRRWGT